MPNANIVDHIGSKVTVWTKDGNAAENRTLHTVDEFGLVISNQDGQQTFIPWVQVKYVDYPSASRVSTLEIRVPKMSIDELERCKELYRESKLNTTSVLSVVDEKSTKELSNELAKRIGVETFTVAPHQEASLIMGGQLYEFTGPATILVNRD